LLELIQMPNCFSPCRYHRGVKSKCIWEYTACRSAWGYMCKCTYVHLWAGWVSIHFDSWQDTATQYTRPDNSRLDQTATWSFTWVEVPGELTPNSIRPASGTNRKWL